MSQDSRISLRDIAENLDLARITVSMALRDNPRIAAETRRRVHEEAKRLGYRPNPRLSRMMSELAATRKKANGEMLAYMTTQRPDAAWHATHPDFSSVRRRAAELGYLIEPFWICDPALPASRVNKILWARGVEGLILEDLGPEFFGPKKQRTLPIDWSKFSVVEMHDTLIEPALNHVRHDHFRGMVVALEQLESLGYRRIGLCLRTEDDLRTHHRWGAAYLLWRNMRGLNGELPGLIVDELDASEVCDWVRSRKLDAVLGAGPGVLQALREGGMDVPKQVGFASLHIWGVESERVSGIDQESDFMGTMVVDMLAMLINRGIRGIPEHPVEWATSGKWVQRQTTRELKGRRPLPRLDEEPLRF